MSDTLQTRCFPKFHPSFVDESLFGARKITTEPKESSKDFDPPWITKKDGEIERSKPLLFYCPSNVATADLSTPKSLTTTANPREIAPSTLQSNLRVSLARKNKQHTKFIPSYVDESLFKSERPNHDEKYKDFEPPWVSRQTNKKPKPILWDYSGSRPTSSVSLQNRQVHSAGRENHGNGRRNSMGLDNKRPWR